MSSFEVGVRVIVGASESPNSSSQFLFFFVFAFPDGALLDSKSFPQQTAISRARQRGFRETFYFETAEETARQFVPESLLKLV